MQLPKREVEQRRLVDYALQDDECDLTFTQWWKPKGEDDIIEVQYPHQRHRLAGKPSNHSKPEVMSQFLEFVDHNSQPNGRQASSYSAQYFFLPKFTRIHPPKVGEKNYEEKCTASLVCEFNRVQREENRPTCGSTAASEWLHKHRPKHALHPSMTDYCDTCKYLKEQLSRQQAILNRLQQSGSASEDEIRATEAAKATVNEELEQHKVIATKAREYYRSSMNKCAEQWKKINVLTAIQSPSRAEREELLTAQHCFTLVISADYQQSKLVPTWGRSEQPGSTYYFQKVSHDIFGIVDHRDEKSTVYTFDERIGPKNTDHTVSLLTQYHHTVKHEHPWIKRLAIFLDNATSTNKNKYLFSWAMEMVDKAELEHLHISFMIAGHTKFAPDRLFSIIGSAYKAEDVFTIDELKALCETSSTCHIETGDGILTWRETLLNKYSDLPGVRKYHDFLVVKAHDGNTVMKVREKCFTGAWKNSPMHVTDPWANGTPTSSYRHTHTHEISAEKMANMVTMYDRFISPDRRPDYLPPCAPVTLTQQPSTSTEVPPSSARKRKQSKCSTEGCDGTGHKNPSKWDQGHTTKAGCPRAKK